MGSTEAYNPDEKACPWEACSMPTQVDGNLFGLYIGEWGGAYCQWHWGVGPSTLPWQHL